MDTTLDNLTLVNLNKEPIFVRHADLERADENSQFRSNCPVCKHGVLFVMRDQQTFELLKNDRCCLCGQPFVYTDIGGGIELFYLGISPQSEPPKKDPVRKIDL